ncbi:oxidoreductase [Nocardia rhizosphaerihabitans]|uniref:Short-chain dehydrogenase/reductase n=1 Tax=Nocardia rhizosphaerihabitans TaxID=1691570 RepID=A0ABQ2L4G0_9NOCA|nr:oxidoreductase [Nocardia rhizosphaerihabitans]GGO00620.1 short-chain dehydrogenase/reductase [Nocardia rhizosphaerihabitans]
MTTQPVALVTGASSGIGKSAAIALAQKGFRVFGTGRVTAHLAPLEGVTFLDLDVTDDAAATAAVATVIAQSGRLDVLVNNAGIGSAGAAEENSAALARNIFDINVFGVIRMTNAALPHMRAQGSGRIVNLSSILGIIPQPYMAVYAASKHAVEGYSESLDHEVREYGVRVLLIEPAYTNTAFDANSVRPDRPLHTYALQRRVFEEYLAESIRAGDDPAVVAKAIVAAATDTKPKPRYPVGRSARVSTMRRLVPAGIFDKQLRKLNQLPA